MFSNIDDFSERQRWLDKISKKLEEKLREGKIFLSRDKFVYSCNRILSKAATDSFYEPIFWTSLHNIEQWLRDEKQDIFGTLTNIVDENEIKPLIKQSIFKSLYPVMPDIIKGCFILIAVLIFALLNQTLAKDIIGWFT